MRLFTRYLVLSLVLISLKQLSYAQNEERCHQRRVSNKIILAKDKKATHPIVISKEASVDTEKQAELLAYKLNQISGAKFEIKRSDEVHGITLGVQGDFKKLQASKPFDLSSPAEQQGYEIKSDNKGLYIVGATSLALAYAIYDFLESFGYRYYFPTSQWEIIPKLNVMEYASFVREIPDYYHRRIWAGFGVWNEFKESTETWNIANKNGGYALKTGHSYEKIIKDNVSEFTKHPEYYALIDGKREIVARFPKFCISNAELRKLVIKHALNEFKNNPTQVGYSVDPSDGGGWCECSACLKIGSPSTRVVLLANEVASAVRKEFIGKRIGIYAYNLHSLPPEIDVDKDVVVSVATRFIKGNLTLDEILEGWRKRRAVLGVREYYDVVNWSWMLPSKSLASNFIYLNKTIPIFYKQGARYLNSEASDDWGASGLGYYLANRFLWNIDEVNHTDKIKKEFFEKCFGPAAETMSDYFKFFDGSKPKIISEDLLGRMYSLLEKAKVEIGKSNEINERINDLVLYTRYVEMYQEIQQAKKDQKDEKVRQLMDFSAQIKQNRMIHTHAMSLSKHWKSFWIDTSNHSKINWKIQTRMTESEIVKILKDGISNNKLLAFEAIDFTEDLIPAPKLKSNGSPLGTLAPRSGSRYYYTYVDKDLNPIEIKITGGLIPHYRNKGNVKVRLFNIGGASDNGTKRTLVEENATIPPDGQEYSVKLYPKQTGLHMVGVNDGNDRTNDEWDNYNKIVKTSGALNGVFYFYVPKGTKVLGLYSRLKNGYLINSSNQELANLKNTEGYYSFSVAPGEDGKIWSFKGVNGEIKLMTVPAYFTLNPNQFLLPREVVISDHLN